MSARQTSTHNNSETINSPNTNTSQVTDNAVRIQQFLVTENTTSIFTQIMAMRVHMNYIDPKNKVTENWPGPTISVPPPPRYYNKDKSLLPISRKTPQNTVTKDTDQQIMENKYTWNFSHFPFLVWMKSFNYSYPSSNNFSLI